MTTCLHPCPSCAQHLRATETACPFCQAALPEGFGVCARPAGARGRPASRAALLFVGATVAASCGGTTESGPASDGGREAAADSGGGDFDAQGGILYGPGPVFDAGPVEDAGTDGPRDASPDSAQPPEGGAVLYGPAMIDSGEGGN